MKIEGLKDFLDHKAIQYNTTEFIEPDPIKIPHQFHNKQDIEISAFLTAIMAWGNRKAIQKSAAKLMQIMYNEPYEFIVENSGNQLSEKFYYRTFQYEDVLYFLNSLSNIYRNHGGLEHLFNMGYNKTNCIWETIFYVRSVFFEVPAPIRTYKHFSNPMSGSACKRLNLFLRWMVRKDNIGVDFGMWKNIPMSALKCPLDLHSGNIARKLGLLTSKQNNKNACDELTDNLKKFDKEDPVKYDYALFGVGVNEGLSKQILKK